MASTFDDPAVFTHHTVTLDGLTVHYVEQGSGPLVILLHGFPYTWFEWRHQIAALAGAGYRVVAPDIRGFGESGKPDDTAQYTMLHSAGDVVGLLGALGETRAVLVGHDLGAWIAAAAARLRPDLFRALALLSTPVGPREAERPSIQWQRLEQQLGGRLHHHYFQEPGVAEALLDPDIASSLRGIYFAISGEAEGAARWRPITRSGETIRDTLPDSRRLPKLLSGPAFAEYVRQYGKAGFAAPLAHYRCRDLTWELTAAWAGQMVHQPTLFLGGAADPALPLMQATYDTLEATYPNLTHKTLLPGIGHGAPEEAPETVNTTLIAWLSTL